MMNFNQNYVMELYEIKTRIDTIKKSIQNDSCSIDSYYQSFYQLLCIISRVSAPYFDPGQHFFRLTKREPTRIKDLSYPPEKYTKMNRANRIGKPIFYCSWHLPTVFYECKPNVGEIVYLSCWETTKKMVLNAIGYSRSNFIKRAIRELPFAPWLYENSKRDKKTETIFNFFDDIFTQENISEAIYKASTAISECMILKGDVVNGIFYPSVGRKFDSESLAIVTKFVDKHLKFIFVEKLLITSIKNGMYDYQHIDSSIRGNNKGNILWNNRPLEIRLKKQEGQIFLEYHHDAGNVINSAIDGVSARDLVEYH